METVVTTTYDDEPTSWLIGFPLSVTSSTTVTDDGQTFTHTVTNSFEKETGTLDASVLKKFVGTAKETTSTITRNEKGVVTTTVNTAKDYNGTLLPSRTQKLETFLADMYPQKMTNALNQSTNLTYNRRFGAVESSTDPNGLVSTTSYDALGRAITTSDALGTQKKVRSFYCSSSPALIDCPDDAVYGTATFVVNASVSNAHAAPVTVEYYDRLQRLIRSEVFNWNGDVVKVDSEFYSDGNLYRRSEPFVGYSPNYWTTYESYDVLNRPEEINKPDGGAIEYSYDTLDGSNVVTTETATVSTPAGSEIRIKSTFTNALGQVDSVEDTDGNTVVYTYNAQGSLVHSMVNNNTNTVISIDYDVAGNKISMVDPDAKNIAWRYDGFGQLRKQIWQETFGSEKHIEYQYDKLGRKVSRQDVGGSSPATYSWTWDTRKKGLLSTATGNGFTENYYYNAASQINQTTTSLSGLSAKSFTFTYDDFGRLKTKTYPSGLSIRNDYHAAGALVRTRNDGTDEVLWAMGEASDTRGTLTQQIYGNSVISERQYNPTNGLIASILTGNAQINSSALNLVGNIQNLSYTFDSIGNLYSRKSQRTNAAGTALENLKEVFSYDSQNRLTGLAMFSSDLQQYSRTFNYDSLGNLTSRSDMSNISYNQSNGAGVHAITTAGDTTYHYDAYGNLSKRVSSSNGTEQLAWDAFNKPTQIGNTHFYYGPNHQRYKQVSGGTTTFYLAGGQYEVVVKNGVTTEKSYVGSFLVESKTGSSIENTYLHRDHLGSVEAMTDENGVFIARMSFDAWGNRREAAWGEALPSSTDFVTTRGFTGHEMLDSHKLVHMNGRVYDPIIGRFLSPDLFVQSPFNTQSYNRYSYVMNNPLSMVDPSGYLSEMDTMHSSLQSNFGGTMWSTMAGLSGVQTLNGGVAFRTGKLNTLTNQITAGLVGGAIGGAGAGASAALSAISRLSVGQSSIGSATASNVSLSGNIGSIGAAIARGAGGRFGGSLDAKIPPKYDLPISWLKGRLTRLVETGENGYHSYRIRGLICATTSTACNTSLADDVFSFVNKNDVPFTSNDSGSGRRNLLGMDPIEHIEDIENRTSVNVTLDGHTFHPGDVTHRVHFENGNLYYDVIGTGTGKWPQFNIDVGIGLFQPGVEAVLDKFGF